MMTANTAIDLASQMLQLATQPGWHPSRLDGVSLLRQDRDSPPTPVLHEASVVIVGQGCQRGYLGGQVLRIDPGHCLVVATPMQFECATSLRHGEHLLALVIRIDPSLLDQLLRLMDDTPQHKSAGKPQGMLLCPMSPALQDAAQRLLHSLRQEQESRVLGPAIVREILYRILLADAGQTLRALFARHGRLRQIQRSIEHIHRHYALPLSVALLAEMAGMSSSAFHESFKAVTGYAPIQYLKNTRLHQARHLLLQDAHNISQAAYAVGYASPSQFSREFKRLFGLPPRAAIQHLAMPADD
ncbi:AraC family transcriptional regulator [Aquitalea sp. ASV15]|uniref:AraC family transcriptional regulator n=1 Tax=Aquitalea sp. ASV15 TaxID=2795104 RepID=UPI0018EDC991|nr:AraC family transcriptional regulator [Aquitalea sp. ASV15]